MIEKGVADAVVTFPWGSIVLFGIDKVTKYHMEVGLYATPFVVVLNKSKYDQMSATQKKAVDEHCIDGMGDQVREPVGGLRARRHRQKIKALEGHEDLHAHRCPACQEWKNAAAPLEAEWVETVKKSNVDGDAALKEFRAIIAKYKAGS